MAYDNTNKGAIWKNDDKQTDKHPDFRGSLNVGGVEFWVSAWKRKETDNPKSPALRFSIEQKEQINRPPVDQVQNKPDDNFNDEIPF